MTTSDLESNRFLELLTAQDRAQLQPYIQTITVSGSQLLHAGGEEYDYVLMPYSSVIGLKAPFPSDSLVDTVVVGREGVVGALSAMATMPSPYAAHALVTGRIARLPKWAFRKMLDSSPHMRELVARFECRLLTQVQQSVCCAAAHPVEARLCRWLLEVQDRSPQGSKLAFTQDLIAQSLGVRRTTITLVAGKLQETGVIRWRRGQVQIANRSVLEQHVCNCYAAMNNRLWMLDCAPHCAPDQKLNGPEQQFSHEANFRARNAGGLGS